MPKRLIAFVAAFALAFAIFGCSSGTSASSSASAVSSPASSSASVESTAASSSSASSNAASASTESGDGYEIENLKLVNKDGNAYIAGTLANTSDKQSNIVVSWYVDGKDGNGIGFAEFTAPMMKPKETCDFEVPVVNTVGASIRYDDVKQFRSAEGHLTDAA